MDPIVLFLKEGTLPEEKGEPDKVRRKAPCFWLSEEQKLYTRSFFGHTCYVSILKQWSHSWKNNTREFVEVILGADHYPIGPLLKGIGGQVCRKKHKSM